MWCGYAWPSMSPEEEINALERVIEENHAVLKRLQKRLVTLRGQTDTTQRALPFREDALDDSTGRTRPKNTHSKDHGASDGETSA